MNSSTQPGSFDELKVRAKWPTVVGWLSIIFGSLSLTCGTAGTALMLFFLPALMEWAAQSTSTDPPPAFVIPPIVAGFMIMSLLWQIALVIAGISTVMRKPAGRPLHLMYAIGFALTTIPSTLLYAQAEAEYKNSEPVAQWQAENANSPLAQGAGKESNPIFMALGMGINLAWPTFCLFWFIPAGRSERALRRDEEDVLV